MKDFYGWLKENNKSVPQVDDGTDEKKYGILALKKIPKKKCPYGDTELPDDALDLKDNDDENCKKSKKC